MHLHIEQVSIPITDASELPIEQITLQNSSGIKIVLLSYGASLIKAFMPAKDGTTKNVAMQPDDLTPNVLDVSYCGATIGPCAGRIPHGKLTLNGRRYQLPLNEGAHHLHGGPEGFSRKRWRVQSTFFNQQAAGVTFMLNVAHMQDGYPGERAICVTYTLDQSNNLTLDYRAVTNQPTLFNMTNHIYWNLSGDFTTPVYDHQLQIPAQYIWYNSPDHLPLYRQSVQDTPFDFTSPKTLSQQFEAFPNHPQLQNAKGWNNAFELTLNSTVAIHHAPSGRTLTLMCDSPAMVLYTGGYLNENTNLAGNIPATPSCALALEPQCVFASPSTAAMPGIPWTRRIRFTFLPNDPSQR